jgi:peroxiredoxin
LENYARDLEPELKVNYCKLVVVTVDDAEISRELRNRIGAEFPFLIDADRTFIEELDIVDYTDPKHSPIPIPYTFVLDRNREIYRSIGSAPTNAMPMSPSSRSTTAPNER